jgi:hypothetical protein
MKNFLAGLLTGAAILALASCATPSPQVQLTVDQALSVGEAAGDGINVAIPAVAPHMTPAQATSTKKYLDAGNSGISAAYAAEKSGNLAQAASLVTEALGNLAAAHNATKAPAAP